MAGAAAISAGIPMSPCGLLPSTLPSFHLSPFSGPFYSLFFILTLFTSTGLGVSVSLWVLALLLLHHPTLLASLRVLLC